MRTIWKSVAIAATLTVMQVMLFGNGDQALASEIEYPTYDPSTMSTLDTNTMYLLSASTATLGDPLTMLTGSRLVAGQKQDLLNKGTLTLNTIGGINLKGGTLTNTGTINVNGFNYIYGGMNSVSLLGDPSEVAIGAVTGTPGPHHLPADAASQFELALAGFVLSDSAIYSTGPIQFDQLTIDTTNLQEGMKYAFAFSEGASSISLNKLNSIGANAQFFDPIITWTDDNKIVHTVEVGYFELVPVPEPSSVILLSAGLAGLVGIGVRRRMREKNN